MVGCCALPPIAKYAMDGAPGIEAFFTELGSQKELNPPLMMEIARKYGITIMPPKPNA